MDTLHLPSAIENSERILVAGAGGGFDVYAGLPIYERLRLRGKKVFLANLSFVALGTTSARALTRALYLVEPPRPGKTCIFLNARWLGFFLSEGRMSGFMPSKSWALHPSERATRTLCNC
jgi:hypothetical protein